MTYAPDRQRAAPQLQLAIVLSAAEDECTVYADEATQVVSYAEPFPGRAPGECPGNLVAIAGASGGSGVIVRRWFDAVVVDQAGRVVTLWEPNHGTVVAQPRGRQDVYRPGSRAYVSAGLPAQTGGWPDRPWTVRGTQPSTSTRSATSSPTTTCGTA